MIYDPQTVLLGDDRLLTPAEVAAIFRVKRQTITRWAADGLLDSVRTPGNHRRYRESDIHALLDGDR